MVEWIEKLKTDIFTIRMLKLEEVHYSVVIAILPSEVHGRWTYYSVLTVW
jgi:hypothetical protein